MTFLETTVNPSPTKRKRKRIDTRKRPGDRHKVKGSRVKKNADGRRIDAKPIREFIAFDTEGWGKDELGRQYCQLMVAAKSDGTAYVLDHGRPLKSTEILDFIIEKSVGCIPISFSFGYDVTTILRDAPNGVKENLVRRTLRDYTDDKGNKRTKLVRWGQYRLDNIPRKIFEVRKYPPHHENPEGRKYGAKIYDVWSFFASSFVDILAKRQKDESFIPYVPNWDVAAKEEFEFVAFQKGQRDADDKDRVEQAAYCRLECVLLCRVMDQMRTMCRLLGFPLKSFVGAGSVAGALFLKHDIKKHLAAPPKDMEVACARAFFGGRFETASLGEFKDVYYYDINSAYPTEIQHLPCLADGTWKRVEKYDREAAVALWEVKWDIMSLSWCPFPFRSDKGAISFPSNGWGHYWQDEVRVATEHWPDDITVLGGWVFTKGCDHQPFSFIPALFQERLEHKAAGRPQEKPIKLGMNSLFGKAAQTVGSKEYHCMIWAGMITSGTRAKLLRAIMQAPDKVLSTATDSISSLVPLDLPCGKKLGEWEEERVPDIFIAGDGIAHSLTNKKRTRTRGIGAKEIIWDVFLKAWREHGFDGEASFKVRRFEGLNVMVARGKTESAGCWSDVSRTLRFASHKRLVADDVIKTIAVHNTIPPDAPENTMSLPYAKMLDPELVEELAYGSDAQDFTEILDQEIDA